MRHPHVPRTRRDIKELPLLLLLLLLLLQRLRWGNKHLLLLLPLLPLLLLLQRNYKGIIAYTIKVKSPKAHFRLIKIMI